MDALPLNLRLRKGGIPYPRLKMNINSSDLCSHVTRYGDRYQTESLIWVMHLQLPNTHLGFVPMRLLCFKHPYLANESKFPFWNGGHVLRWRGPFFFLPTNPLNNGIISLFSGDYLIVIVGRNWQLLPTILASRSPRFVGYEISYFRNTNSPVCACCNKFKCQRTNTLIIPITVPQ